MASAAFATPNIRNVVVVGHGGSGKTTLVDSMCYVAGMTNRKGEVERGTALTDFTPEEAHHKFSVNLAVAHAAWKGAKINLIDTPGYLDFFGDVVAGARVADSAICVIDAVSGVEVGTERTWDACEAQGLPRMFFVSMMDRDNASFRRTFAQIQETLTGAAIPVEVPIGAGSEFKGIVNLFSQKAHLYKGGEKGDYENTEIPEELSAGVAEYREKLIETIAAADDELLEAYLDGEELDRDRVLAVLARGMLRGEVFPVFCGSGATSNGVRAIMNKIVELMPSPEGAPSEIASAGGDEVEISASAAGPLAAMVFKTTSEPQVGDLSYFRVFGGEITNGLTLLNPAHNVNERISHLATPQGGQRQSVDVLAAGDIGVVAKLRDTHTGDTLCDASKPVALTPIDWPDTDVSLAITAKTRGDEDKIGTGLAKLHEEDPTFTSGFDPERGQTIIRGLGEMHLNISLERLARKYGVEVVTEAPRIAYRETITKEAAGQGRHKKQSGGRGQFGDCWIRLRPKATGDGYGFVDKIKGGVIPTKFVPAVNRGILDASKRGVLAGYPLVDFEAEVYDGSHHAVDSSDLAFQLAGSHAFQNVALDAGPVILEPIMEVEVETPEDFMGEIMGDLNQRRGRVLGMEARGHRQVVKALVPQAELYMYSAALRSLTHGKAMHKRKFSSYERTPPQVAERVIADSKRESDG